MEGDRPVSQMATLCHKCARMLKGRCTAGDLAKILHVDGMRLCTEWRSRAEQMHLFDEGFLTGKELR